MSFSAFLESFNLKESLLIGVSFISHLRDVEFRFSISALNLSQARGLPPDAQVVIVCKNCMTFQAGRSAQMALFKHSLDAVEQAQVGRTTVVGIKYDEKPVSIHDDVSAARTCFQHLLIETMDPLFEVSCEEILVVRP